MIKLEHIKKKFDDKVILDDISLELEDTGLVVIKGETGSGKTTLLNIISGLDKCSSGKIYYDNKIIKNKNLYRKENISIVFQEFYLLDDLSVYDNLVYYCYLHDMNDKKEIDYRVNTVLKTLKIHKYKKKLVKELSGGEKQRVAISRILLFKTKIIILDEPTSNLDYENSKFMMDIFKRLAKESLVILVSHNIDLAYNFADKIYELKGGKLSSFDIDKLNIEENNIEVINEALPIFKDYDKSNNLINLLKNYLKNNIVMKKKNYLITFILSIFLSLASIFILYATTTDTDNIRYSNSAYLINKNVNNDGTDNFLDGNTFIDLYVNHKINYITENKYKDVYLFYNDYVAGKKESTIYLPLEYNKSNLIYGTDNLTNDKEIVVSKGLLDSLRENISLDLLLNKTIKVGEATITGLTDDFKIVGITDSNLKEAFYYKAPMETDIIKKFSLDGSINSSIYSSLYSDSIYITSSYSSDKFELVEGKLPVLKNEVLHIDDGTYEVGSKYGMFIVSGLIKANDDFDAVFNEENMQYYSDYNTIELIYNKKLKDKYVFMYNGDREYNNLFSQYDYLANSLHNDTLKSISSYFIPVILIFIIELFYFVAINTILDKKNINLIYFDKIEGRRNSSIIKQVALVNLIDICFIVIPYLFIGISYYLIGTSIKNLGIELLILNPFSNIWYYLVLIISIACYYAISIAITLYRAIQKPIKSMIKADE